jgi:hypothetical protein
MAVFNSALITEKSLDAALTERGLPGSGAALTTKINADFNLNDKLTQAGLPANSIELETVIYEAIDYAQPLIIGYNTFTGAAPTRGVNDEPTIGIRATSVSSEGVPTGITDIFFGAGAVWTPIYSSTNQPYTGPEEVPIFNSAFSPNGLFTPSRRGEMRIHGTVTGSTVDPTTAVVWMASNPGSASSWVRLN